MQSEPERLLSLDEVMAAAHKSRAQIYRDVKAGKFPAPLEVGPNAIAWLAREVATWQASRPRRNYGGGDAARAA
jgi:prophage regulatory protein